MLTRVVVGGVVIAAVLALARTAPQLVGGLLLGFSVLLFVLTIVGLTGRFRFPERLSPAWGFAIAFGMYLYGVALVAPPNGVVVSSDRASDLSPGEEAAQVLRRVAGCLDRSRSSLANAAEFLEPGAAGLQHGSDHRVVRAGATARPVERGSAGGIGGGERSGLAGGGVDQHGPALGALPPDRHAQEAQQRDRRSQPAGGSTGRRAALSGEFGIYEVEVDRWVG